MEASKTRNRHGRSYPIPCPLCQKEFSSNRALSYHNSRFHTPATCSTCNMEFDNARLLDVHEKKQHKTAGESKENFENYSDETKSDSEEDTVSSVETFKGSVLESEKSVASDLESNGSFSTLNNGDLSSSTSKKRLKNFSKTNVKRKKPKAGGRNIYSSDTIPDIERGGENGKLFEYLSNPLTSAYRFKKFFKVPHAKESLPHLTSSESSLVDCILDIGSLQESAAVMKENPYDIQSIYKQIDVRYG